MEEEAVERVMAGELASNILLPALSTKQVSTR